MADKLEEFVEFLEALDIIVIKDYSSPRELLETITKFNLPPSDAVIALTCKHYGIYTILTFDEDFKRIPWLKQSPSPLESSAMIISNEAKTNLVLPFTSTTVIPF